MVTVPKIVAQSHARLLVLPSTVLTPAAQIISVSVIEQAMRRLRITAHRTVFLFTSIMQTQVGDRYLILTIPKPLVMPVFLLTA
jgi:hypothetical protein